MIASYKNDTAKGPGFGLLEISDVPFDGNCVFNLVRASDHLYLGADGWGAVRSDLTPLSQSRQGGRLILSLLPVMVARLDTQENYRISLKPADGSGTAVSARLQMENIIYAPEGRTGSLTEAKAPVPSAQEAPAQPEPEPSPRHVPPVDPLPMNAEEPTRRRFPWAWLLLAMLLLALACAAIWWFCLRTTPASSSGQNAEVISEEATAEPDSTPDMKAVEQDISEETPAAQAEQPAPEKKEEAAQAKPEQQTSQNSEAEQNTPEAQNPDVKKEDNPVADQPAPEKKAEKPKPDANQSYASEPDPAPATEKQENTPPPSVQTRVNEFLRSPERTPQKAAALGSSLQASTPEEQDAVYRLYYYAAENGDSSLLLPYAACHDPSKPQWGSIEKDAVYAMQIYNKAGGPEAEAAKEALHAWVKREAENGNKKALAWQRKLR